MFARTHRFLVGLALLLIGGSGWATPHTITVGGSGNVFTPNTLTINAGDTVTFTNAGGFHNVVADGLFRCARGCDGDGSGGSGDASGNAWSDTITFSNTGTVNFYCEVHGAPGVGMHGTLTVNAAQQQGITLGGYLSGNWFDPSANQSGHGFQLEFTNQNNTLLAIWFVYPPDGGGQNWIYAQGAFDPTKNTATIPAVLLTGPKFPPLYNNTDLTQTSWGTLTFTFTDCDHGTASWNSTVAGYGSGSIPIQRITSIQGTACPQ